MKIRGKDVVLSAVAVGTAAIAGYYLRATNRGQPLTSKADVGAKVVEEVPTDATIVDATNVRLRQLPAAITAIERAIERDAEDEWEHVTIERDGAWDVVDVLRRTLPYYEGDVGERGVYVRLGDRVVVLDAIGWARLEEPAP